MPTNRGENLTRGERVNLKIEFTLVERGLNKSWSWVPVLITCLVAKTVMEEIRSQKMMLQV